MLCFDYLLKNETIKLCAMDCCGYKLRVLYDYDHETGDKKISISRGETLFLICKTDDDWWQVIRNSTEKPFFVPARYVQIYESREESNIDNSVLAQSCDSVAECDSMETRDSFNQNSIYKGHHKEKESGELEYFLPSTSDDSLLFKVDECVALGYDSGVRNTDKLLEVPCVGVVKQASDQQLDAASLCSVHTLPHSDDCNQCDNQKPLLVTKLAELPQKHSSSQVKMVDNETSKLSNETSSMNAGKAKSKLAKSRSFKTKNELKKLSRLDQESVNSLSLKESFVDRGKILGLLEAVNYSTTEAKRDPDEKLHQVQTERNYRQPAPVPLVFHNELYNLSNSQDDANKTMDSGNISSESLFTHEEDISDSGTSHKSGLISSAQSRESIQEHSDVLADDTSKEELESSREEIWTTDVPIPPGWKLDYDEESGEQCYINEVTQAKWFSSTDGKGRVYFFEENSSVSTWTLPDIVIGNNEEAAPENDLQLEATPLRNLDGEKKSRVGKARSLFLSDQKHKESTSKSSSIPRNWLQLYDLDKDVLKYGSMNRTKITENGKKMSKKWASAYVILTDDALCFYKDLKNSQQVGLQPELSMQLSGARVEPGDKLSSRKHIFLISSGTLQLLCECETAELAAEWRSAITNVIARLSRPTITPTIKVSAEKPKTASISRSKSLQVKNREAVFDDATTSEEQQMKIRDRLKKFFNRRPTREILASKGIYKDEPVFDSHLAKVCPSHPPFIPDFVRLCIAAIESKEENMKTDGLYRASGNLSHVQKIRLQVDQNNLSVLQAEEDVHVLTGALKLFFRELKVPLIPYQLLNEAINAGGMNDSKKEKIKMFREIVKKLPPPNHDTLKFLLRHLKRVTQYEEFNRMHIANLAIVFGPTLMWREKEYHQNMAVEYMQQNSVIEFLLQHIDDIFR